MTVVHWRCEALPSMSAVALYRVLKLRSEVFVVEQQCIYLDPDGRDEDAWHLQALDSDGAVLAYARLLPPQSAQDAARIGRVITAPSARGTGLGRALMQEALVACARLWPDAPLELGAQAHLRDFYGSFGFAAISDVYDEDGIPHIDMRRDRAGG